MSYEIRLGPTVVALPALVAITGHVAVSTARVAGASLATVTTVALVTSAIACTLATWAGEGGTLGAKVSSLGGLSLVVARGAVTGNVAHHATLVAVGRGATTADALRALAGDMPSQATAVAALLLGRVRAFAVWKELKES